MPIKILTGLVMLAAMMIVLFPRSALPLDLNKETIYTRRGFDPAWITHVPRAGDTRWLTIPGSVKDERSVILHELPIPAMPHRTIFSLKKQPPENFTFLTEFTFDGDAPPPVRPLGILFPNIGENWAVYLNGVLLRSEIHLDEKGAIILYRHLRDVLIPLDSRLFITGKNVLAVRIIGDPTNIDAGFHRSTPFFIDDLEKLSYRKSERISLVLIFLYLFFGVYHLFIYLKMPGEKHNLFYGAFSVLLFVYLLSRTNAVYSLIADSTVLHRIEYCSLYALLPLFGAFADLLLTGTCSRLTKIIGGLYALLILVTVLPVSNPFAIDVLRIWQVTALVPLVWYTFVRIGVPVIRRVKEQYALGAGRPFVLRALKAAGHALANSTAGNLMIGALIMVGCAVFDIVDSMFWSYNYVLATYGFFIFTMGITLILADRFIGIHKRLEGTQEIINNEMALAAHVQKSLLPASEEIKDWDIAVSYKPRYGPSGDFYDLYIREGRLQGMSLFDVSGHGISSALITMVLKPLTYRTFTRMRTSGLDAVLGRIDEDLSREIERSGNFVTCILLRVKGDAIEYVNAGHPHLLHKCRDKSGAFIIGDDDAKFRGEPLGVGLSEERAKVVDFKIARGDLLLLYSDCILESRNSLKERYGIERLLASLNHASDGSAEKILEQIMADFHAFADKRWINDDLTVIVVKRR